MEKNTEILKFNFISSKWYDPEYRKIILYRSLCCIHKISIIMQNCRLFWLHN